MGAERDAEALGTLDRSAAPGSPLADGPAEALDAASAAHPPAPWRLRGECALIAASVPLELATQHLPPGLEAVAVWPGRSLGGVLLARYREGSTLHYDELIVFSGLARRGARLGFWVSHIWVDLPASVAGGRQIWALPKELASFDWRSDGTVSVARAGQPLLEARLPRAVRRATLPLLAPIFSSSEGALLHTVSRGTLHGAPGRPSFHVPAGSPLEALGLAPALVGLTGVADLPFPAPGPLP